LPGRLLFAKGGAMTGNRSTADWRRIALLLVACALLFKLPAGWMPQASASGVTLGWCSGMSHAVPAEAQTLLAKAIGKPKPAKPAPDQPCAYAAAAQPLAAADPLPAVMAASAPVAPTYPPLALLPGRGLAAPPPLATGPPLLA
jgi:hypothetical protein